MNTIELATRLRELNRTMTRGKWHTVEKPWRPDGVGTHVIAGSDDPHAGTPVLDSIEIDEWPSDAEPNYAQSDIDLGGVCFLRNNLPALIDALERGDQVRGPAVALAKLVQSLDEIPRPTIIDRGSQRWRCALKCAADVVGAIGPPCRQSHLQPAQPDDQYPGVPVQGWTPPPPHSP